MTSEHHIRDIHDLIKFCEYVASFEKGTQLSCFLITDKKLDLFHSINLYPKVFFYSPKTCQHKILVGDIKDTTIVNKNGIYYGGKAFPSKKTSKEWDSFENEKWFFPFIHLSWGQKGATATVTSSEELNVFLKKTPTHVKTPKLKHPMIVSRSDVPNKKEWSEAVIKAQKKISDSTIKKVVLSRETRIQFSDCSTIHSLVNEWISISKNHYVYYLCLDKEDAFLSLSPEALFHRKGRVITSDALAGTSLKNENPEINANLEKIFRNTQKEVHEHDVVKQMIKEGLSRICVDTPKESPLSVMKLTHIQHLLTVISGTLKEKIEDSEIIDTIFPTPAVAGTPTDKALSTIDELEPHHRGWYAGILGIFEEDETECIVAIRSMRFCKSTCLFYAGAGIVKESSWENEWNEVENKLMGYFNNKHHVISS